MWRRKYVGTLSAEGRARSPTRLASPAMRVEHKRNGLKNDCSGSSQELNDMDKGWSTVSKIRQASGQAALAFLVAAAGSLIAVSVPSPTQASVPDPPASEQFQAPLCSGSTSYDPREHTGVSEDLSVVFGQRLSDYNAGRMVMLYNTAGLNQGDPPICGTRHVAGVGAVSEWMYCTDMDYNTCAETDQEGRLTHQGGTIIEGLEDRASNPRLSVDQERLVRYILTNDLQVLDRNNLVSASDESDYSRDLRQLAVWCITEDQESLTGNIASYCHTNFSELRQQEILDSLSAEPTFTSVVTPHVDQMTPRVGETVVIEVSTNVYATPISIDAPGAEAEICSQSALLAHFENGQLVVNSSTASSETIHLCLTWETSGSKQVRLAVTPSESTPQALSWVQSPTLIEEKPCQVYSNFNSALGMTLSTELVVDVAAAENPIDPGAPGVPTAPEEAVIPPRASETTEPQEAAAAGSSQRPNDRQLASTGGSSMLGVGTAAFLLAAGGAVLVLVQKRARQVAVTSGTQVDHS